MFSVAIYAAAAAGVLLPSGAGIPTQWRWFFHPWPILTTSVVVVIGVVSTLQLVWLSSLRSHLQRDAPAIERGQVWRLGTAILTQDGGWVGLGSNLVSLVLVGVVAESQLGRRRWLVGFAVPVVVAEVAGLSWQPAGAGNSVAVIGLGGAMVASAIRRGPSFVPAMISVAAILGLALMRDVHGAAGATGLTVGFVMVLSDRQRPGLRDS